MTKRETFLHRWSRRKRAAAPAAPAAPESTPPQEKAAAPPPMPQPELPFDLSKLPPLDSITAQTDIRAYLAPGVPAELTRAALRRAWAADPKIRDFVGLSENAWDFNAPGGLPGFGPLQMTDELRRQVTGMVGRALEPERTQEAAPQAPKAAVPAAAQTPETDENSTDAVENIRTGVAPETGAAQEAEQPQLVMPQKRHGGALPT
jgi:Protein of unknown function (DUF3306)